MGKDNSEHVWQVDLSATNSLSTSIASMVEPGIYEKQWQDDYIVFQYCPFSVIFNLAIKARGLASRITRFNFSSVFEPSEEFL